jgi:hypothetical protein
MRHAALCLLLVAACANKNPYEAKKAPEGPPPKIEGVHPDKFDCNVFVSADEVGKATMTQVFWMPPDMKPTPGTPPACIYQESAVPAADASIRYWQFQLDCRPIAIPDAERVMAEHKNSGAPEVKVVEIGRGGVDHQNIRLIAIDDDTDCTAWIVAPDAATRDALARLVLARLTRENRPTTPKAVK